MARIRLGDLVAREGVAPLTPKQLEATLGGACGCGGNSPSAEAMAAARRKRRKRKALLALLQGQPGV